VVCANQQGLKRVMNLATQRQLDVMSARIFSEDFLGDVTLLRDCEFFLQVGGGGFAEFAWSSSLPFFIVSYPWNRAAFRQICRAQGTNNQVTSWQSANQIFLLKNPKSKDNFENQLKKFWYDLSAVE
ncbi:MAG: hypothetical protein O2792_01340, partial [Actinomycetota bacterium]|nr:hypothetical protein [Actinomycetota bacterium]